MVDIISMGRGTGQDKQEFVIPKAGSEEAGTEQGR